MKHPSKRKALWPNELLYGHHMKELKKKKLNRNSLEAAFKEWLLLLPPGLVGSDDEVLVSLARKVSSSYSIYKPMLLLPRHYLNDPTWTMIYESLNENQKQKLFENMTQATHTTHVAMNAPIPNISFAKSQPENNAMRKPFNITPIFGDFGPLPISEAKPTSSDFDQAFWVSAKQNGIIQTWAPMHTMFSRGNISEKARLLQLPSVSKAHRQGLNDGKGWSAVDLFAGIGYFAFSYVKAGAKTVLCWEINPWSIEGFRRGAEGNRWQVDMVSPDEDMKNVSEKEMIKDTQFVIFCDSNVNAQGRIGDMREKIAPIRHVNCGLLPSSMNSWRTAIACLDHVYGGWLHVHENLDARAIDSQSRSIVAEVRNISQEICTGREVQKNLDVTLEHIQKVKSYAPNVVHCVLDIRIIPNMP